MEQPTYTIQQHDLGEAFYIDRAHPDDTDAIMRMLVEIAEWLNSQGSSQWGVLLRGEDSHDTVGAIRRGDVFVVKQGDEVAGMVTLLRSPSEWDERLWGEQAGTEDGALYLHRLAVSRKYASVGLGKRILKWSSTGIWFENKDRVRLDCVAGNDTLNAFYARNGYTYLGENDGYSIYEKLLGDEA
ncbi:GNAT family N-acetyltransferase [Paenibacillus hubeiensis]|uniref:GNAT family N-acetyltransferase n=1 Tax=Paenibacillus hubeiensis TaxID=3077330 RepID=UPI0031BA876F